MVKAEEIESRVSAIISEQGNYDALHDWIDGFIAIELSHVGRKSKNDALTDARLALAINDRVYAIQQIRHRLERLRADAEAKITEG